MLHQLKHIEYTCMKSLWTTLGHYWLMCLQTQRCPDFPGHPHRWNRAHVHLLWMVHWRGCTGPHCRLRHLSVGQTHVIKLVDSCGIRKKQYSAIGTLKQCKNKCLDFKNQFIVLNDKFNWPESNVITTSGPCRKYKTYLVKPACGSWFDLACWAED